MLNIRRTLFNLLEKENMRVLGCLKSNLSSTQSYSFSLPANGKTSLTICDFSSLTDSYKVTSKDCTGYILGNGTCNLSSTTVDPTESSSSARNSMSFTVENNKITFSRTGGSQYSESNFNFSVLILEVDQ